VRVAAVTSDGPWHGVVMDVDDDDSVTSAFDQVLTRTRCAERGARLRRVGTRRRGRTYVDRGRDGAVQHELLGRGPRQSTRHCPDCANEAADTSS
jgi:hypothetical protein